MIQKQTVPAFPIGVLYSSILCLAAILSGALADAAEFETPVALTGGTVVARPGEVLESATVLIDHGRISAVGKKVAIPDQAEQIDATGLWIYPGFIDATSHLGIPERLPDAEELARLEDEERDIREGPRTGIHRANRKGIWPHRTISNLFTADEKKLSAHREAGFTTALITPHPAILGGAGDLVQLSGQPLRRAIVRPGLVQIASFWRAGEEEEKAFAWRAYPVSVMGAVALMRQTFLDAEWYRQWRRLAERHPEKVERVPSDPVLEAMGASLDGQQTLLFEANTPSELHHALDLADEFGQPVVILGGKEAWKVADRLVETKTAVVATLEWPKKPRLVPEKKAAESEKDREEAVNTYTTVSWTPEWEDDFFEPLRVRREKVREWEEQVDNVRRLMDAGVPVALTTRDLKKLEELWEKLRDMMKQELAPDQALACLTTGPAEVLGVGQHVGIIAPGKLANLTVLTRPLEDEKARVRYVYIDGERFAMDVLSKDKEKKDEEKPEDAGEEEETPEETAAAETDEEPEDRHPWACETEADRKPDLQTGGNVLLSHASVLTVTQGILPDTDVLVADGRIKKIGRNLKARKGTTVIDLTGYWLMPGIVDPHSHLAIRGGINEFSESVTPEVRIADVVDHTQLAIYQALTGGVTTIQTMHGSANTIGGQNAVLKLKYNTSPAEMLVQDGPPLTKFAMGENVIRANARDRGRRFPNSRMGVESVLRQAFNDAIEYRKERGRYRRASQRGKVVAPPRQDMRLDTLNSILEGEIWIHAHCYRADEILRLLAVAEDYGVRVATLQHVLEGYRIVPEMYRHGVGGSSFSDWWAYKLEAYNAIPHNPAMMFKGGVVASVNSDSAQVIRYLNLEAAKTLRYGGLTADEALRLITINPAIQIGLEDRIGSVERGKDGDFAVFTGHPLDTFAKCVLTLVDGEVYFQHRDFDPGAPGPGSDFVPNPPRELLHLQDRTTGVYAIIGGTVHPVSTDPIERGAVLIENGVIAAVADTVDIPAEAQVIDASGLHVYPGLIDAATELGLVEISRIPSANDTHEIARFQPDIKSVSAVNPHSTHIEVARCEGITTAGVLPRGGIVSGQGGVVRLGGWSMPEMLRVEAFGLVIELPSLPTELDPDEREEELKKHQEAIEEIEAYIRKARHYARVKSQPGRRPDYPVKVDVQLDAMIPYVEGRKPVLFRAETYKEILEALRFAEAFDLKAAILGGRDAWKCADRLAERDVPVIITSVLDRPVGPYERFDGAYANAAELERAGGILFCIATGSSAYVKRLPIHAGMAVAHGLSSGQAVRSITLDAAQILGLADRIGSLEPGKAADVIITTGHPCQAGTRTVACFLDGKPVHLTSAHERNYEKFRTRPVPELTPVGELRGAHPMRLEASIAQP